MAITIRPYQDSDKQQIIDLITYIQQIEFQVPVTLEDQPDLQQIPPFYQVKNGEFWVATHKDNVVGTIALIDCGDNIGCIRKMFVKAEYRSQYGIAQQLLDTLLAKAKTSKMTQVYLGTVAKLKAAIRFYERNGFEPIAAENLPPQFPLMAVDTHFFTKVV
jgi:putative acetyltransferase